MNLGRGLALFSSWGTSRCCSPAAGWSLQREAHPWRVQKPFVACLFCLQCNNPMTKEPKLQAAMRIVPEWQDYDQEIKLLQSNFQKEKEMGTPAEMPGQHTHGNLGFCTPVAFSVPVGLCFVLPHCELVSCSELNEGMRAELNHQGVWWDGRTLLSKCGVIYPNCESQRADLFQFCKRPSLFLQF